MRRLLSNAQWSALYEASESCPIGTILNDARNLEELTVDFVYTAAKVEGNSVYDRIDVDNLLRGGVTAGAGDIPRPRCS